MVNGVVPCGCGFGSDGEFVVSDTNSDELDPCEVLGQVRILPPDDVGVDVEVGIRD